MYFMLDVIICGGWHNLYMLLKHGNLGKTSESGAKFSEIL